MKNTQYYLNIVGNNIKKYREIKKLTIKELSLKSNISEKYLKRIEKGTAINLSCRKLYNISMQLDIYVFQLFEE